MKIKCGRYGFKFTDEAAELIIKDYISEIEPGADFTFKTATKKKKKLLLAIAVRFLCDDKFEELKNADTERKIHTSLR